MYQWLSHGDPSFFYKREFSLTIDDIYLRYKSYKSAEEFKNAIVAKIPGKIDIGPTYSVSVSHFKNLKKAFRTTFYSCFKIYSSS